MAESFCEHYEGATRADTRAMTSLYGNSQDPREFHEFCTLCRSSKIALDPGLNLLELRWNKHISVSIRKRNIFLFLTIVLMLNSLNMLCLFHKCEPAWNKQKPYLSLSRYRCDSYCTCVCSHCYAFAYAFAYFTSVNILMLTLTLVLILQVWTRL